MSSRDQQLTNHHVVRAVPHQRARKFGPPLAPSSRIFPQPRAKEEKKTTSCRPPIESESCPRAANQAAPPGFPHDKVPFRARMRPAQVDDDPLAAQDGRQRLRVVGKREREREWRARDGWVEDDRQRGGGGRRGPTCLYDLLLRAMPTPTPRA